MLTASVMTLELTDKKIETLEEELKGLTSKRNEQIALIVQEMDADNVTKITVNDKEYKRDVITNFSIDSHDWADEKFFSFIEQNGAGDIIKIKKEVHPMTRKAYLKEWLENGNKLPDFIKESYMDTIKYKKG